MEQDQNLEKNDIPEISFEEFEVTNYAKWKEEAIAALKGADFDRSMFTPTYEGITLKPIYLKEDLDKLSDPKSYPGQYNYLRGVQAGGYISGLWTIAQLCDAKMPQALNAMQKRELLKGNQAIGFYFDTATLMGIDDPQAAGKYFADKGVSMATFEDLKIALADIEIEQFPFAVYCGASNLAFLANLAALAKERGIELNKLKGAITADPIGELVVEGSLNRPMEEYYDEVAHSIAWAAKNAPELRTLLIDADVYHDGGASAVQEAAYAMSEAVTYIKAMLMRGLEINTIAKHIRFHFSIGANFFMEVAKLRSVKMLWAQVVEAFGGDEEAKKIELFVSTSTFTQTTYDPYVNLLRAATQSFSAVVGGINGMNVKPFDYSIRPSDEFSRRIARNIQIMFQHEFNFLQPIDPAGGSWYIEPLTEEFTEKAWLKFQELEAEGGIVPLLMSGKVQEKVNEVLESRFKNLASRKDRAVGNNMYPNMTEELLEVPTVDFVALQNQREIALQANKADRDEKVVNDSLAEIKNAAGIEGGGLVDLCIKAIRQGATMGEINNALAVDASGTTIIPIAPHRWTERFEEMRFRTETFERKTGENVKIFLANMGPIPQHKARADFVTSFMQVAKFEVLTNNGFKTVEEAVEAALESQANVAIVCSTDATYPELAPAVTKLLKEKNPSMKVFLAGAPSKELKEICDEAGMDDYISVKSNCYDTLPRMQKERGMF